MLHTNAFENVTNIHVIIVCVMLNSGGGLSDFSSTNEGGGLCNFLMGRGGGYVTFLCII